jgi:hypothetical protein
MVGQLSDIAAAEDNQFAHVIFLTMMVNSYRP